MADKRVKRYRGGVRQMPLLVVIPALLFLIAVHFAAPLAGAFYAFTNWNGIDAAKWIGLGNFREVFDDPETRGALFNTLKLAFSFVVLVNVLGLSLALALNRLLKTRHPLRSIFFLPAVMSPIAIAFIWQYIFQYNGPFNQLLGSVGLSSWKHVWLGDPHWALWMILVVLVWQFVGLTMVIYMAGLQAIPDELVEAAIVDGATTWRRFRTIVFPLLAPAFTVATTLTLIIGLRVFDQVLGLTAGGPANATQTLATEVYEQTFENGRFGYGAALALVLTVLVGSLAITQAVVLRRRETRM